MENISFKHWIVAGALSGVVIGILALPILYLVSFFPIFDYKYFIIALPFLLFYSFAGNVFLGVIVGMVLFFMYNRLLLKRRLFTNLFISTVIVTVIVFPCAAVIYFLPLGFIAAFQWAIWSYLDNLIGLNSPFVYFPTPLIGAAFGFLINYFINRMERRTSK